MKLNLALVIIGIIATVLTIMVIDGPWYAVSIITTAIGLTNLFYYCLEEES